MMSNSSPGPKGASISSTSFCTRGRQLSTDFGVNATGTLIMLEAVRDFREQTGQMVGVKPAGGIKTTKDAIKYLVMVNEICGSDWLDPDWFRFGASTLLNDLLMQRTKMTTGRYSGPDYFTLD